MPHSATLDAVTLVAAAVAIAVDQSRNAALEDCLRDRELQAMRAAHLESLIAQRMFTSSTQLPHSAPPVTWRTAHTIAHNETVQLRAVMDQAARALRRGYDERAAALLEVELAGPQSDSEPHESEPTDDSVAEPVVLRRCAGCGRMSASVTLQWPAGRWTGVPEEDRMLCDDCEAADP